MDITSTHAPSHARNLPHLAVTCLTCHIASDLSTLADGPRDSLCPGRSARVSPAAWRFSDGAPLPRGADQKKSSARHGGHLSRRGRRRRAPGPTAVRGAPRANDRLASNFITARGELGGRAAAHLLPTAAGSGAGRGRGPAVAEGHAAQ